ncbi:MAG: hypothetical protein ACREIT_11670 [Tepidisphaeraceae bacterium]
MDFLKSVAGKVLTGVVVLGVVAAGISWWQMDEATRQALLSGSGKIIAWVGVVLFLPWAGFFLVGRVAKLESNAAGAALVVGLTLLELLLLAWLFDWSIAGATAWTFVVLGALFAAVYNLFTCDWIAEKVG